MTTTAKATTRTPTCIGTDSREPQREGAYGRRVCLTCGNLVFPNADGKLRKHVAKDNGYGY